jgi:hypothetical protein
MHASHGSDRERGRRVRLRLLALPLLVLSLAAAHATVFHPRGTLRVASRSPRAGDSLAVSGLHFAARDAVTIVLVGVAGRVGLGAAATDSAGAFKRSFLIPVSTKPGAWRLVAEANDGDEVASLDLTLQAASVAAPEDHSTHTAAGGGSEPTGEPLALARARSAAVSGSIWMLVLTCLVAGAALLRTRRTPEKGRSASQLPPP